MAGSVSFGGLVSGLDTNNLVTQLVNAEKLPITGYKQHQTDDQTKLSTLATIISGVQALSTAAQNLSTSSLSNPLIANSTNTGIVQVTAGSGALAGSHSVTVTQLAQAQVNSSTALATDATPGAGTLNIAVGSNTSVPVTYGSGDSLESVAAKINALGIGAVASVLNDGTNYRLMISAKQSGTANGLTFTDSGSSLGFTALGSQKVAAADAKFTLDNVAIVRSTNNVTDAASGLSFNLTGVTPTGGAATTVTVGLDTAGLQAKVQAVVDAYNSVQSTLSGQLAYTGTTLGSSTFFGDATLQLMQFQISGIFAQGFGNGGMSAAQLGINLSSSGTSQLSFDTAKFTSAVAANPGAAQNLFAGASGAPGLAQSLTTLLDSFTRPLDGLLTVKQDSLNKDISYYDGLITQTTNSANSLDTRLRAQFAAMERSLALLQTQGSILSSLGLTASATSSSNSNSSTNNNSSSSNTSTNTSSNTSG